MIAIPNVDKPKFCDDCFVPLSKCEYFAKNGIDHCPLIEIVECKDCTHSKEWYRDRRLCYLWAEEGVSVFEDGYCSYGERRADETIEFITFKKMVKAVKEEMREVQNFAERRNDGTVCSYGVPANAGQHTQRVESVGKRRADEKL